MTSREKMVENNLGLVHACAGKFKNRGVDYDDLFQAGCVVDVLILYVLFF